MVHKKYSLKQPQLFDVFRANHQGSARAVRYGGWFAQTANQRTITREELITKNVPKPQKMNTVAGTVYEIMLVLITE